MVDEVKIMLRSMIKNKNGQAIVETAIVLPLLLAIVLGIIEFGNIYSHQLAINNLARHSVRMAVVATDKSSAADNTLEASVEATMSGADVEITRSGSDVTATVHYSVQLITGPILGTGSKVLTAVATMKAE